MGENAFSVHGLLWSLREIIWFFVSSVWPLGRTPAHVDSTKLAPVMGSLRKGRREERAESDPKLMLLIL